MAQGLQVWNSAGNLVVDTTQRLTLYLGTLTLKRNVKTTAIITDTDFSKGKPFYVCSTITSKGSMAVSFSGNTMSCELIDGLSTGSDYSVTIIYGVY